LLRGSEAIASHECADGACHAASAEHNAESTAAFPRVHDESAANLCPQAKSAGDTFHVSATATALCSTNEPDVDPQNSGASAGKQNAQRRSAQVLFSSVGFAANVTWTRSLFNWFGGGCERSHRYAAYVVGAGGEGKTRIVRAMIQGMNVFECCLINPFAFDGFNKSIDILLVDDVNWDKFDRALRPTLLNIMARQPAVIQRKFKRAETVTNEHVLTIFTSNYTPLADDNFLRRSYSVWAKVKACKDVISQQEDDPGDDLSSYKNPTLPSVQAHAAVK